MSVFNWAAAGFGIFLTVLIYVWPIRHKRQHVAPQIRELLRQHHKEVTDEC